MTQRDLNRAVARATGETVHEINRRGFIPLVADPAAHERLHRPVAWEDVGSQQEPPHLRQSAQV